MKKKIFKNFTIFLLTLSTSGSLTLKASNNMKTNHFPAQKMFSTLVDGYWQMTSKTKAGKHTKSIITVGQGLNKHSFTMLCKNFLDEKLKSTYFFYFTYHWGRRGFIFISSSDNHDFQEGHELESSEKHIVFNGTAYHQDGLKPGYFWKLEIVDVNTYMSQIMVFENGKWRVRKPVTFRRYYKK